MGVSVIYENNISLDRLLIHGELEQRIRNHIKKVIGEARNDAVSGAKSVTGNDRRQSYKAVKRSIYKNVLGGTISILNKRKAGASVFVDNERKQSHKDKNGKNRGGNRMRQSERTKQMLSYYGADRGFILRFLNSGTKMRTDNKRGGNRGSIQARNWFPGVAQSAMEKALDKLAVMIEEEIEKANK